MGRQPVFGHGSIPLQRTLWEAVGFAYEGSFVICAGGVTITVDGKAELGRSRPSGAVVDARAVKGADDGRGGFAELLLAAGVYLPFAEGVATAPLEPGSYAPPDEEVGVADGVARGMPLAKPPRGVPVATAGVDGVKFPGLGI